MSCLVVSVFFPSFRGAGVPTCFCFPLCLTFPLLLFRTRLLLWLHVTSPRVLGARLVRERMHAHTSHTCTRDVLLLRPICLRHDVHLLCVMGWRCDLCVLRPSFLKCIRCSTMGPRRFSRINLTRKSWRSSPTGVRMCCAHVSEKESVGMRVCCPRAHARVCACEVRVSRVLRFGLRVTHVCGACIPHIPRLIISFFLIHELSSYINYKENRIISRGIIPHMPSGAQRRRI